MRDIFKLAGLAVIFFLAWQLSKFNKLIKDTEYCWQYAMQRTLSENPSYIMQLWVERDNINVRYEGECMLIKGYTPNSTGYDCREGFRYRDDGKTSGVFSDCWN